MARLLIPFLTACVAACVLSAQDRTELRSGSNEPIAKKGKLFDGGALGMKMPPSAASDILGALREKRVQQEIGLLPLQLEELQRLNDTLLREVKPLVEEFNQLPKAEQNAKAEAFRKDLTDYLKGVQADLDRILLPEQQQRLQQVAFQMRMQKSGTAGTLLSPDVLRDLAIGDGQAEQLRGELAKIEERYRQSLNDLEIEKERQILALFTPAQQNQLKARIGPMMRRPSDAGSGPKTPNP